MLVLPSALTDLTVFLCFVLQPEDFESVGMKKLEMNRILAALANV